MNLFLFKLLFVPLFEVHKTRVVNLQNKSPNLSSIKANKKFQHLKCPSNNEASFTLTPSIFFSHMCFYIRITENVNFAIFEAGYWILLGAILETEGYKHQSIWSIHFGSVEMGLSYKNLYEQIIFIFVTNLNDHNTTFEI